MSAKGGYTYIIASTDNRYLYIGVTSNLYARIYEHKEGVSGSVYATSHKCMKLVYWEFFPDIESAIDREKRLKKFKRHWKEGLVDGMNSKWVDLFDSVEEMQ
jgi:putative endonuclease